MKYTIRGLRLHKYVGESVSGHNCDFEYYPEVKDKYFVYITDENDCKSEIEIYEQEGECGSGWTTATFGNLEIRNVDKFKGFTHLPITNTLTFDSDDLFDNMFFEVSENGGDAYYPMGHVSVNMEFFKETARAKEKRLVWILYGESGLGKSYLASQLNSMVYETDENKDLPDTIVADVIVVGNKYNHSPYDVIEKVFGEAEVVKVGFHEYE